MNRLGEMGQHLGVQRVGLGHPTDGFAELAHLAGIDPHRRQVQRGRRKRLQLRYQGADAGMVVGDTSHGARRPKGHIQPVLAPLLLRACQRKQLSGLFRERCGDNAIKRRAGSRPCQSAAP